MVQGLTQANPFSRLHRVFRGWWLVGIGSFTLVLSAVPIFHGMTVWAVALESHFGWSRTQLGFALTFGRIEGGIMGPVEGYLSDRVGARRMVLVGMLIVAAGFLLFSQIGNLWMFYLAFVVISLGQGLGGWVPIMTLLNHWFVRQRGTAMGMAMTGTSLGALVLVPALAWAVDPDQDRLGWRLTAGILAGILLAAALVVPRLIRNRPQEVGLRPDGDPPEPPELPEETREPAPAPPAAAGETELTVRQALKTQAFWFIAFGHGFGSMVLLAIMSHLGLMMKDMGYGVQTTAWIVTVYTAVSMVFQLAGGYIGDRIPKNLALFIFTSIQGAAVLLIAFSNQILMLYAFAVLFGIGFGGRTPLTTAIRGEYFGRASFGKLLGISSVPMNVLLLISSPMAGYMRDELGDYDLAFLTLAILTFVGAVLFLLARRPRVPVAVLEPQAA